MRQRGNILFLILLAIVLFVALTYAVNSGMRGGGKDASEEKTSSIASEIINYASLMENTVQRLMVTGGCKDTELGFVNNTVSGYTNPYTPADGHCKVYDPAGGGLNVKVWDAADLDESNVGKTYYGETFVTSYTCIYGLGTAVANDGAGLSCWQQGDNSALVAFIPYLDAATCAEINKRIYGVAGIPMECNGISNVRYVGSWPNGSKFSLDFCATNGIPSTLMKAGPRSGCFQMPANGSPTALQNQYIFWQALYAR